ncbi:hypothetical protein F5X99DRAFT_423807 [Biscogniauxia marginata]|nr:hypothetical protein F5X99DRAFT_423807 [Biscogniauxia marginata]
MRTQKALKKAAWSLNGLKFESRVPLFEEPNDAYTALVGPTEPELPLREVISLMKTKFTKLLEVCIQYDDVYRRLRGNHAFWYLIFSAWDADYLFQPTGIDHLVSLFVGARRRFLAQLDENLDDSNDGKENDDDDDDDEEDDEDEDDNDYDESLTDTDLIKVLDQYISIVDEVSTARTTRGIRSLSAPRDLDIAQRLAGTNLGSIVWPPGHFVPLDIAIMSEKVIRKEVFGITPRNRGLEDELCFPHDQDQPTEARKYLSWLSLTEKESNSNCALFLAPIAFLDHKKRQEWYEPTGHQSRRYATIHEFLDYAHAEFEKTGTDYKKQAICLLTPWFFDVEYPARRALQINETAPVAWQKSCYRAGMMLSLNKLKLVNQRWTYRLVLFKPGRPTYATAAEPSDRKKKQEEWVVKLLDLVDARFDVEAGWTDGAAENHEKPPPGRGVGADSVESSCEIITEIMTGAAQLPTTAKKFKGRHFTVLHRY